MQDLPDPDDTQSFSIADTLRAPIGVTLSAEVPQEMRLGARWLLAGLLFIVVDVYVRTDLVLDVVPDLVGGLFILAGARRIGRVAYAVGPTRSRSRLIGLAWLQLPLLAWMTVHVAQMPPQTLRWHGIVGVAQVGIGSLGAALSATVLARAHDGLGQLSRRDRWSRARAASLFMVLLWVPLALGASLPQEPSGIVGVLVGIASVLVIILSVISLVFLVLALRGSMNVHLPDR